MATLATINIRAVLDSKGVAVGAAKAAKEISLLRTTINGMFSKSTEGLAQFAAGFLSLNYFFGRIKTGVKEIYDLQLAVDRVDNASIERAAESMERFEMSVNRSAYAAASGLAPALEVAANNATKFWEGIIGQDGVKMFEDTINYVVAQFTNLQGIVSGVSTFISSYFDTMYASIGLGFAKLIEKLEKLTKRDFGSKGWVDKFTNDLETAGDKFREAQVLFTDGITGKAGDAYLKQIEDARDAAIMQANSMDNAAKSAEKMAEAQIRMRDVTPSAMTIGSSAAQSAIQQSLRQGDTIAHTLQRQQIAELKAIRAAVNKPMAPANI